MAKKFNLIKKNVFSTAGNVPRHLFFVKNGKVKTSLFNEDGKEFISGLYAENDYLGLIDLFSSKTYLESAKFISGGVCISIRKEDFLKELYANKDLAMYIFTKLNFSVNIRKERLMHMAYDSVRKRTADCLIWLDEIYNTKNEYPYKISFTREDLACYGGNSQRKFN
jgi:CRP-like cAMP-binding protein